MPERGQKQKIQYPGFDYDLSHLSPEQIMEQLGVMGGGNSPLVVDIPGARKATAKEKAGQTFTPGPAEKPAPVSSPVATPPSAGPATPQFEPMAMPREIVQTGPGMNLDPRSIDWKLLNPPAAQTGPGSFGATAGTGAGLPGTPSVDDLLRQVFDVGQGSGMTGGMWASQEQRAFAAKQQLEMMKMAAGLQGDQAKLEAARTDSQTQREFQAGEGALGRKNQLDIAELSNSSKNDNLKLFKQRAWAQAEEEAKGNIPLMSKLFEQKVNAYQATQGDQPAGTGGQPIAALGPSAAVPDAQKIAATLALMSKSGSFGGLDNFNAFLEDAVAKGYDQKSIESLAQAMGSQTTPGGYDLKKELSQVLGYNMLASDQGEGGKATDKFGSGVSLSQEGLARPFTMPFNTIEIPGVGPTKMETAYRPTNADQFLRTGENKKKADARAKVASQLLQLMMKSQQPQQGK